MRDDFETKIINVLRKSIYSALDNCIGMIKLEIETAAKRRKHNKWKPDVVITNAYGYVHDLCWSQDEANVELTRLIEAGHDTSRASIIVDPELQKDGYCVGPFYPIDVHTRYEKRYEKGNENKTFDLGQYFQELIQLVEDTLGVEVDDGN